MPDCNDQDSRFTARVTALTSAWSFGTRHFDDDAKQEFVENLKQSIRLLARACVQR